MYHNGTDWVILASGSEGQVLEAHGVAAPSWETQAGGGDVTASNTPVDSEIGVWTSGTDLEGDASFTFDRSDLIITEAVNNGDPSFQIGSGATESLKIQAVYDTSAFTLDRVDYITAVVSGTADKGLHRFNVDGTDILDIDDGGITMITGILTGDVRDIIDKPKPLQKNKKMTEQEKMNAAEQMHKKQHEEGLDLKRTFHSGSSIHGYLCIWTNFSTNT